MIRNYLLVAFGAIALSAFAALPSCASDQRQWTWEMSARPHFRHDHAGRRRTAQSVRRQHHSSRDYDRHDYRDNDRRDDWRGDDRDWRGDRRDTDDGFQCIDRIRVVGSQWVGTDGADESRGAEESAQKAFMEEVRARWGEQFMDVKNAQQYEHRCWRASVGEMLNQVYFRCEIRARPCRPTFKEGSPK